MTLFLSNVALMAISGPSDLPDGFCDLNDMQSDMEHKIHVDLRYHSQDNFVGKVAEGYKKNKVILTKKAAYALLKAEKIFNKMGYSLLVYDAYRPQKTVDSWIEWSKDDKDQKMKSLFYPRTHKKDLFKLGYVAEKSGHSRGSTIDVTLVPINWEKKELKIEKRKNGDFEYEYMNDGSIDMGTHFDMMDELYHTENSSISTKQQDNRSLIKGVMEECGFINYNKEFWYFTLKDEPYPDAHYDFDIK